MKKSLLVLLLILTLVAVSVFAVACGNSSEPAQNNEDNNETVEVPEYPTQPITIMTAWSAGSSSDLFARIIAEYATAKWGVPVNVINKPGGFGIPGTTELLSSKPDGYTIGVGGQACSSMMCAMYGDQLPFGIEDRTYIAKLVDLPSIFAVNAKSEFYTLEDLIKFAQENPDKFRYSAGSVTSIITNWFTSVYEPDFTEVTPTITITTQPAATTEVTEGSITESLSVVASSNTGKFTIMGAGLEDIAKLPSIPVEVTRSIENPNVIAVPLTMQRAYYSDFQPLKDEIERMEENLHKILERSGSDLGGVVTDAFDFARQQQVVTAWSSMINQTKAVINLLSFANSFKPKDPEPVLPSGGDDDNESVGWEFLVDIGVLKEKNETNSQSAEFFDKFIDTVKDNVGSWLKGSPEEPFKGIMVLNALSNKTKEEKALIAYHLTQRKEYKDEIEGLEDEITKAKKELAGAGKYAAIARSHAQEEAKLTELLTYAHGIDFNHAGAEFITNKEEAAYYLEQAGSAFTAALSHTGEQKTAWFNKGQDWFKISKEKHFLFSKLCLF
jgi:uncharacterized protein YggL (DUF469 family)